MPTNQTRVQIPAYTDHWMRGDRYGTIVKITYVPTANVLHGGKAIAHVKLDKSGKIAKFWSDDCQDIQLIQKHYC